jgi:hypothetical protein
MVSKLEKVSFSLRGLLSIEISMIFSDIFDQRPNIAITKFYSVMFLNSTYLATKKNTPKKTANLLNQCCENDSMAVN